MSWLINNMFLTISSNDFDPHDIIISENKK